jgi:hypothetical protein
MSPASAIASLIQSERWHLVLQNTRTKYGISELSKLHPPLQFRWFKTSHHTQAPTRCAPIEGLFYLQRTLRIFLLFLLNAILSKLTPVRISPKVGRAVSSNTTTHSLHADRIVLLHGPDYPPVKHPAGHSSTAVNIRRPANGMHGPAVASSMGAK